MGEKIIERNDILQLMRWRTPRIITVAEGGSRTKCEGRSATNGNNLVVETKERDGKDVDGKQTEKSCDEHLRKRIGRDHIFENEAMSDDEKQE